VDGVENGELLSLRELGLPVGKRTRRGFAPALGDEVMAKAVVDRLIALWTRTQGKDAQAMRQQKMEKLVRHWEQTQGHVITDEERQILELGVKFLDDVAFGRIDSAREILDAGLPINFQHPIHQETALHIAASKVQLNDFTNELLDTGECDLLIRDRFGRLAMNTAVFFNPDSEELIDRLARETKAAADEEGIDLLEEEAQYRQQWFTQNWFLRLAERREFKHV
jgi:hypothetical protein